MIFKTAQLKYPILYQNKNNIENNIEHFSIDKKFIKKFLHHDYLGNFYTLSSTEYLKNVEKYYQKYLELSTATFIIIMKRCYSS